MMENIRPIKSEADYDWALKEIRRYFDQQPKPNTRDGDRFDVLATLIEAYEDERHPIAAPDPVELIAAYMKMTGRTQRDLANLFDSSPRASEILNRKRALTMEMAYKLNRAWGIPADALIQPYHLKAG